MFIILLTISAVLLALYFHRKFTYWERHNVPSYPSPSYIKGNMQGPFNVQLMRFYNYFKRLGAKHGGFYFFQEPIYMPIDPELLKRILTKDFDYFDHKGLYTNEKDQPISGHLFMIGGERWRKLRVKLTPTFTSGKLKNMFPTIVACAQPMLEAVQLLSNDRKDIDIKDVASKFTTDVIGSCAFGIDCNSFKSTTSDFHYHGKHMLAPTTKLLIKRALSTSFPRLSRALGLVIIPPESEKFYTDITKDTLRYRRVNNVERNDFLQLLIQLQNQDDPNSRISDQDIINQSFVFYVAGFETSSSVMSFALMELSKHTDVQEKVRAEIQEVLGRHNQEITYDSIQEMKYLGQVIDETLRKYPPLTILNRECTKRYPVPGTDFVMEKGTKLFIPVYPLQYDEEHYPEPEKFDPERFSEKVKNTRHPYTFLPFGEGPRQCIGLRFGYLQTKIGLVSLLRKFKFALHSSMKYPVEFGTAVLILNTDKPIVLTHTPL